MQNKSLLFGLMVVLTCLMAPAFAVFDVNSYLYATETLDDVRSSNISYGGTLYTLYTISSRNTILVRGGEIVQDISEIRDVLKAKCFSNYPTASELDEVQSLASAYNASRNGETGMGPAEERCLVTTGQNIIDCYDVTTCQAACSSAGVTQGTCGRLLAGYGYGLVYALLYYAESRHNMDSNMTAIIADVSHLKGITKAEQVTPEIAAKFDSLYNHTVSLKAAGDSMLSNLIFVHYLSGGYYLCLPPPLENNSINSAVSKSFDMKTRTACFGTLNSDADALLNNTQNRINYYINVKQKASIASDFQELMDRYNSISGNVTGILSVFEVPDIRASVANIENYSAMYYIYTSAQNYEAAAGQVDLLAKEVENLASLIVDANAAYSILSTSRNRAIKNLDRLNLVISPSDSSITAERDALIVKFNMLEANLSAKISYSDVPALAEQYDVLAGQAQQLTNKLGELEAGKVSNIFSNFARGMSLAILNAISDPLGVREDEKRTWMSIIPTMFILIVDIIVLAVIALAFFFLVWRRTKEFLRKKIINTWMLIFGFIILIIIGMSFALNSMIKDAIGPSSYFEFASYLESSDSVYIFVEYSSSASTAPLTDCAEKVESVLTARGKSVTVTPVVDGVCRDVLYSECLTQVGDTPIIKLKYGKTNSTQFYTFYKIEAIVSGDAQYLSKCSIAELLS